MARKRYGGGEEGHGPGWVTMCNDDCGQAGAALLSTGTSGHTSGALGTERGEGDHNIS